MGAKMIRAAERRKKPAKDYSKRNTIGRFLSRCKASNRTIGTFRREGILSPRKRGSDLFLDCYPTLVLRKAQACPPRRIFDWWGYTLAGLRPSRWK